MKNTRSIPVLARYVLSVVSALVFLAGGALSAQDFGPAPDQNGPPPQAQLFPPDQLSNLVAPIALYPDNLLSQVLVASTYPLEVVEAAQWLQGNRGLSGQQLLDAARQQNWDPSIQALVVFPDVLNRLSSNVQWTTALGNAFLAQQADVMSAVQRLRAEARASGKLNSTSQLNVMTEAQNGQSVIDIQPADPQVIYVPQYNPEYIWGPPVYGYYPPLYYPDYAFGFYPGIYLGGFFGGWGLGGWGGWGWGPNWFGGVVITRPYFFSHYGFHDGWGHGGWHGYEGSRGGAWAHNPDHRHGVPYSNGSVANRFGHSNNSRGGFGSNGFANSQHGNSRGQSGNFGGQSGNIRGQGGSIGGQSGNIRGQGGSIGGQRGNVGGQGSGFQAAQQGARSFSAPTDRGQSGGWQRFNQPNSGARSTQPNFRSNPSFGGGNSYRSAPSYSAPSSRGNSGSFQSAPAYRSSPSFGGAYRSTPSGGGNFGSSRGNIGGGGFAPRSNGGFGGGGSRGNSGGFSGSGGGGGFHGGGGGGHAGGGHR